MDGKVAIAPSEAADFGGTTTPWVDLSAFDPGPPPPAPPPAHHSPPMPDFHGFGFGSAPVMPLEPAYSMSVAPIYSNVMHMSLPAPSWPSMLTAQPAFPDTALSSPPQPVTTAPKTRSGTTPRRTLTDEDRRAMCEYHENNKGAKQTDIGAMFGVERSTVSKVLRQKDKYLNMDDESRSSIKKSKGGKVPDIERALANWVRNYQRQGHTLTDAMIREKARFFAVNFGSPDGKQKVLTASWLEKFKQKNNIKVRRCSTDLTAGDDATDSPIRPQTGSSTATVLSPASSTSPIDNSTTAASMSRSPSQSQESAAKHEAPTENGSEGNIQSDSGCQREASASGETSPVMTESPSTPLNRPSARDQSNVGLTASPQTISSPDKAVESTTSPSSPTKPTSTIPSPRVDTKVATSNNVNSNSVEASRRPSVSPVSPGSPTQDEARRALELVMNYFQSQPSGLGLQAQEYIIMGKLMEKLELAQNQVSVSVPTGVFPSSPLQQMGQTTT